MQQQSAMVHCLSVGNFISRTRHFLVVNQYIISTLRERVRGSNRGTSEHQVLTGHNHNKLKENFDTWGLSSDTKIIFECIQYDGGISVFVVGSDWGKEGEVCISKILMNYSNRSIKYIFSSSFSSLLSAARCFLISSHLSHTRLSSHLSDTLQLQLSLSLSLSLSHTHTHTHTHTSLTSLTSLSLSHTHTHTMPHTPPLTHLSLADYYTLHAHFHNQIVCNITHLIYSSSTRVPSCKDNVVLLHCLQMTFLERILVSSYHNLSYRWSIVLISGHRGQ